MAEEREVYLAASWALEPIGVEEIREEYWAINPKVEVQYDSECHMLSLRGPTNDRLEAQYANILTAFIEEHKTVDLLEQPRLRRLELANLADYTPGQLTSGAGSISGGNTDGQHLLDLELIGPSSQVPPSQTWMPSSGTHAYYADDRWALVPRIAARTGTTISREILNGWVCFCISGNTAEAIEEARRRLGNLEGPMKLVVQLHRSTAIIGSEDPSVRYRILKQVTGDKGQEPAAFSRFLPPRDSRIDVAKAGLLALQYFDRKTKAYKLPRNLVNPPVIRRTGFETIEAWKGFIFPGGRICKPLRLSASALDPLPPIPPPTPSEKTAEVARLVIDAGEAGSRGQGNIHHRGPEPHVVSGPAEVMPTPPSPPTLPANPSLPEREETSSNSTVLVSRRQTPGIKSRKVLGGGEAPVPKPVQVGSLPRLLSCLRASHPSLHTEKPSRADISRAASSIIVQPRPSSSLPTSSSLSASSPLPASSSPPASSSLPASSPPPASFSPARSPSPALATHHSSLYHPTTSAGPGVASRPTSSASLMSSARTGPASHSPPSARSTSFTQPASPAGAPSQPSPSARWTSSAQTASYARPAPSGRKWSGGFLYPKKEKKNEEDHALPTSARPITTMSTQVRSSSSKEQEQRGRMETKSSGSKPPPTSPSHKGPGGYAKKKSFPIAKRPARIRRYKPSHRGDPHKLPVTTTQDHEAHPSGSNEASVTRRSTGEAQPMQEPSKPSPQAPVVGQLIDLFQDWEEVPAKPSAVAALEEARALNKLYNSDVVTNMPPSAASQVFRLPSILEPQSAPPENYGAHRQADDHPQDPRDLINFDTPKPNQFEQRSLNCHVSADLPSSDADVQSGTGPDVKTLRGPSSASMKTATEPSDKENVSPQSVSSGKEGTPECPDGEWHQPICWTEVIKDVFRQLQPALSAARSFPGFVSLEVQIGLIMVEAFPSKMWDIPLTLQKLQELLLDDTGLEEATVSTNFMNRVTTSPADVDHILNIESNGQRVFERDVAQRSTCYEFHCKTPAGEAIIVKVDDKRGMTIASPPPALLTTVQLAFPAFVWDAAVFLHGHKSPDTELDPHIERAAQFLVRELWIEPNQKKVHLLACTTSQLKVEQVIVKRTTLHRYRQGNTETPTDDDICLRITETQDLLISTNPTGENVFKAWCAPLAEMTKANRQWWEVGLISPAINKLLKTNESLQLGESTDAWCSADILGNEIDLVSGEDEAASDPVQSSRNSSSISSHPVAAGIGSSGLGGLLRLTESVVQSIDGVGGDNGTMDDGAAGTSSFESAAVSRPAISRVTRPRSFHETDGCTALVVAEEGNGELQSSQDNGRDFW